MGFDQAMLCLLYPDNLGVQDGTIKDVWRWPDERAPAGRDSTRALGPPTVAARQIVRCPDVVHGRRRSNLLGTPCFFRELRRLSLVMAEQPGGRGPLAHR